MGLSRFNPSNQMKILSINTHLTYSGWSEGKLNLAFMDLAKAFFVERGHQVAETFVGRAMTQRKK
jgi:NADPH dehydrogenase (quinone)